MHGVISTRLGSNYPVNSELDGGSFVCPGAICGQAALRLVPNTNTVAAYGKLAVATDLCVL